MSGRAAAGPASAPRERPAVGQEHVLRLCLGPDEVRRFGDAVGDLNPIHFDAAYAATTRFGRPIAHGTLLLGLLGRIMGMSLPGPGTIYLEHSIRFLRPVHVGADVALRIAVLEERPGDRFRLATQVLDAGGRTCVDGEALVWFPEAAH